MILWPILGVVSLLVLVGVWFHERLPRWRAVDAAARREPLTDEQYGNRYFSADQAPVAARLRRIVAEQVGKDLSRLHPDDRLAEMVFDRSFDSLDTVEAIMAIEESFGIEFNDETLTRIETCRDLVNAVAARQPFLTKWRRTFGQALEKQVGVSLPREVLATVSTPLAVAEAVAATLEGQVGTTPSCQSQRAFHLLRSAMMRTLRVPRNRIKPTTPLRTLFPWRTAPALWQQLRDALKAQGWPPLVRPPGLRWFVRLFPLLLGTGIALGLPWLSERAFLRNSALSFWMSLAAELRAWIAIPAVIGGWLLLVRVSKRFQWSFPAHLHTVGDLVPFVKTSASMTWTRDEIMQKVREIVVTQLRVSGELYRDEARFAQDFRMDASGEEAQHSKSSP